MGRNRNQPRNRRRHPHAWAPYNFVPMPDKPVHAYEDNQLPRHDEYTAGRHTGYFDVTLETVTPLYIRGMLTAAEKEAGEETRKKPNFFSPTGSAPAIPGSSLRGMLRSLTEIATSSKMHFVSNNKLVYRAIYYRDALVNDYRDLTTDVRGDKNYVYPSRQMHGGYLKRGDSKSGWVIIPAKKAPNGDSLVLVERDAVLQAGISEQRKMATYSVGIIPPNGRQVVVGKQGVELEIALAGGISREAGGRHEPATLLISNTVGKIGGKDSNRRWYPAALAPDERIAPIPISQQIWDDFKKDRDLNRGIPNRRLENEGDMLFYLLDNNGDLLFFGPTMFFRVPYENSIGDLIPHRLRAGQAAFDYTEALFGYVSEKDENRDPSAYAGRVSVTSAFLTEESPHRDDPFEDIIVPKILSSPKPTTFQHYLEQPDNAKGTDGDEGALYHYGNRQAKLRGRKLYWRQEIAGVAAAAETEPGKDPETSTQHTVIQPVRPTVQFRFKVHFENLSDAELGALIWVLGPDNAPDTEADTDLCHQLGMGKPLGLGVVKLTPHLTLTDRHSRDGRYGVLFDTDGKWFTGETHPDADEQMAWVEAFKDAMSDFDNQPHIQELRAMMTLQPASSMFFSYMQIEGRDAQGNKENQYQGRPVLPRPTEVIDLIAARQAAIEAEQQRLAEQQAKDALAETREEIQARIAEKGLRVGDIIGGELKGSKGKWISETEFWFEPRKYHYDGGMFALTSYIKKGDYQANVTRQKNEVNTKTVRARIVDMDTSSTPIKLICEWVD